MNRAQILDAARQAVLVDRAATHGEVEDSFGRLAAVWSVLIGCDLTPHHCALMLAALKIVRGWGNPDHADNAVDLAGYAACAGELAGAIVPAQQNTDCPALPDTAAQGKGAAPTAPVPGSKAAQRDPSGMDALSMFGDPGADQPASAIEADQTAAQVDVAPSPVPATGAAPTEVLSPPETKGDTLVRGTWTEAECDVLINGRLAGRSLIDLSKTLNRPETAVQKKAQALSEVVEARRKAAPLTVSLVAGNSSIDVSSAAPMAHAVVVAAALSDAPCKTRAAPSNVERAAYMQIQAEIKAPAAARSVVDISAWVDLIAAARATGDWTTEEDIDLLQFAILKWPMAAVANELDRDAKLLRMRLEDLTCNLRWSRAEVLAELQARVQS